MSFAAVPAIVGLCYLLVGAIRTTSVNNKWLPLISAAFGALIGILGFYTIPTLGFETIGEGIVCGCMSGLAATGTNQVFKQLAKPDTTVITTETSVKNTENSDTKGQ